MQKHTISLGPNITKFQVTIQFEMDEEFMTLVPSHRTYINYLINKGIVDSYTVSLETQRSWIVVNAVDKAEVKDLMERSPLFRYWRIEVDELYVFDGQNYRLPALQMN